MTTTVRPARPGRAGASQLMPATRPPTIIDWPELHPGVWVLGSAVLGVAIYQASMLATLHAGVVLLAAAILALTGRRLSSIMALLIYGVMCEVVWRAGASRAPWESGKYLLVVVSLVILVRFVSHPRRVLAPILFVLVLVPGALISFSDPPAAGARDAITFALLGPVALALFALLCRQVVVDRREMRGLLWWAMSPCISMGAIAAWGTITADKIEFGTESLFATAGGFGPNQVSTVLGLGALLAVGIVLLQARRKAQLVAAVVAVGLVGQALITLSRGGVYAAGLAAVTMLAVTLVLGGNRSRGLTVLVFGGLLLMVVLTWAQAFSGGAVENRFSQNDSGRGQIVSAELRLFEGHPVFGVGVGRAMDLRVQQGGDLRASHNEFTRLLAEHGLEGLIAIGLLGAIGFRSFAGGGETANRALAAGLVVWSLATMSHSATRLAAVALIFGLACLRIEPEAPASMTRR